MPYMPNGKTMWESGDMDSTFNFAIYWLCDLRKNHLIFLCLSFIIYKPAVIILVAVFFRTR